jgi:hypothetical protein
VRSCKTPRRSHVSLPPCLLSGLTGNADRALADSFRVRFFSSQWRYRSALKTTAIALRGSSKEYDVMSESIGTLRLPLIAPSTRARPAATRTSNPSPSDVPRVERRPDDRRAYDDSHDAVPRSHQSVRVGALAIDTARTTPALAIWIARSGRVRTRPLKKHERQLEAGRTRP